jgi:hypothetical protein
MGKFAIALLTVLQVGLACAVGLAASPDIIEGAKKEGEMVWYGGGSSEIDEVIGNNFAKKYPFIQPKKFRIQRQKLLVRFEAETRAGKHVADIVRTTDWHIDIFKKKGLLLKYDSPEREFFIKELKDADGHYTALYKQLRVPAYNTKLIARRSCLALTRISSIQSGKANSRWKMLPTFGSSMCLR